MQTMIENKVIPKELTDRNQWALSRNKVPYQTHGERASSTDVSTWASYEDAINNSNHVGYFISEHDPYTVIDLDNCIIDGVITNEAKRIVKSLNSFTEISQSGKGIHVFIKAKKPGQRSKNADKGIEIYDSKRFIVMTGNHLEGTPFEIYERQEILDYIYDSYFSATNGNNSPQVEKEEHSSYISHPKKFSPPLSDDDVLNIAGRAKNGERFINLYAGDHSAYGSQSEADQALCNIIAFYTQDSEQIERIFSGSGLYREKWDRADYKAWTIQKAIDGLTATYQKPSAVDDFQLHLKDSPDIDLKKALNERRFEEIELLQQEWETKGSQGRKPTTLSPVRCSVILPEYISFILFDLEENTRLAMYLPKEGIYTRNTTLMKRVISWLEPKLNNSKAEDVIYHLTNRAEIKEETNSRYLIPVKNGVFNLKTKQLESFNPDYIFTTKIDTPYMDNPSNPVIDGWDIESWLVSIACGDQEIKNLLWQVINDTLNGNYSRKKAIFLIGEGNNGKGTYQELITNLLGAKNIATLKINEFEQRFKLGVLEGKTAVIGDDVPANVYIEDSSNFNSVVTGDGVLIELKNKQPYRAVFRCSVIQSTNGMPKFRNKTNGSYRRILIVPFKADFNGQVENFRIKEEYVRNEQVLQYVLHKAINMDFERFDIPQASLNELEIFKQDNDPILDFKVSIFDKWNIPEVPKYIVYEFYKKFCQDNGYKYLSNRQFHHQFKKHLVNGWNEGQKRFKYDDLMPYVGDLDYMGIGFPDKSRPLKTYKRNLFVS